MTTKHRVLSLLTMSVAVGTTAVALADGPGLTGSFSASRPATGTTVDVVLGGPEVAAAQAGKSLKSLRFVAPPGFAVEKTGVQKTCDPAQAKSVTCPASSEVGSGSGVLASPAVGDVPATAKLYFTAPAQAGDIGGVQVVASALGQRIPLAARIVPSSSGLYLLIPDIDKQFPLPLTVKSLKLTFGASAPAKKTVTKTVTVKKKIKGKTVRKKVKKKVVVNYKQSFLVTPPTCTGDGWGISAVLGLNDGSSYTASTKVACTP